MIFRLLTKQVTSVSIARYLSQLPCFYKQQYAQVIGRNMVMTDSKKRFHVDNQFIMNPRLYGQYYLLQLCDLACSADYEVPIHDHLGYEITYVLSGEGVFYRNSIPYNVSAWHDFFDLKK